MFNVTVISRGKNEARNNLERIKNRLTRICRRKSKPEHVSTRSHAEINSIKNASMTVILFPSSNLNLQQIVPNIYKININDSKYLSDIK